MSTIGNTAVATLTLQNAGAASLGAGVATFAQVFKSGEVPAGTRLVAWINGVAVPVQMDVKTTNPDGSVGMALLSLERPALAAGAERLVELKVAVPGDPLPGPALDLATALTGHSFTVTMTPDGKPPVQVDVLAQLQAALAGNTASFWQQGPLAVQARVEVPVAGSSQRMVFDVTLFKGGGMNVDAQFNNDRSMESTGGRVSYGVTATMDGQTVLNEAVAQSQYQNWHVAFSTNAVDGGQGIGSPAAGWLNIRHDVEKLKQIGAVPDYDLTLKVPETVLAKFATDMTAPTWNDPLPVNGVVQYMPQTGARPDIGFLPQSSAAWLISGDARAAAYALGWAEAASSVPWHFWDAANKTWLNTDSYPKLWTDPRGGTGAPGNANSTGLTQQIDSLSGWAADDAHQPDLSYLPYLMTGERWMLDNLQAQASAAIMGTWSTNRQNADDLVVQNLQVRASAWDLRQIEEAAWASPAGSAEKAYFRAAADANWQWIVSQIPAWTAMQGEAHGWLPGDSRDATLLAPWSQDFFASTAIAAASRGNQDALTYLNWAKNFLIGRFTHAADGFPMTAGAAFQIVIRDTVDSAFYSTWAQIGAKTIERGYTDGVNWGSGYYGQLAMATLAGIYFLTGDAQALAVYKELAWENPGTTSATDFATYASYAVTIPGLYGWGTGDDILLLDRAVSGRAFDLSFGNDKVVLYDGVAAGAPGAPLGNTLSIANVETIIGGAGSDIVTLTTPTYAGALIDLGAGADSLALFASGGSTATVLNAETITGGSNNDFITLGAPMAAGSLVNLGAGNNDRLVLSSLGNNVVTVIGVEYIVGGNKADTVTLGAPVSGATVDLGKGKDKLILSGDGNNTLTVVNVETITGGKKNDVVTLGPNAAGTVVTAILGGGNDKLILAPYVANIVNVAQVETVIGGGFDDAVTFTKSISGAVVDLGGGADILKLAATGANTLTVSNTETIIGGAYADQITTATGWGNTLIDLGDGADSLVLTSTLGEGLTVSNVEQITGGAGAEFVKIGAPTPGLQVDLGGGADKLVLANAGPNNVTAANVETVIGGAGDDVLTLAAPPLAGALVDLGAGLDQLFLSLAGPNTLTVSNTETITGGAFDDFVTLGFASGPVTVDLGAGNDTLFLNGQAAKSVTVLNVETITGDYANDTVTLGADVTNVTIDLGSGADSLVLAGTGTNSVLVKNVETITGGNGNDAITFLAAANNVSISLGGGTDRVDLLDGVSNIVTVARVEVVAGGTGADRITVTGTGASRLLGGGGNDTLAGADGADRLQGGSGVDWMSGGLGADQFVFTSIADSLAASPDTISDFAVGVDDLVFQGLLVGSFAYIGTASFTNTGASRARFVNASSRLEVDVNGDGTADMAITMTGVTAIALTLGDFVWS